MNDLWVFGYGSLMWRTGFDYVEKVPALLHGAHRSLCVFSHVHRGTPEQPGLVLGLDRGGACHGLAFRVASDNVQTTLDYLRGREQRNMVYREVTRPIRLNGAGGPVVDALVYLVDRGHHQYAGRLPMDEQVRLVRQGHGESGDNIEYVESTQCHLEEMGIHDGTMTQLCRSLRGGRSGTRSGPQGD